MAHLDRPFSSFVKQHRPLRDKLNEYAEPLERELRAVSSLSELEAFERDAQDILASAQPVQLVLGGRRPASIRAGEWALRADGVKVAVTRHHIAIDIFGEFLLCCTWPSDSDGLLPADDPGWPESELSTLDDRDKVWSLGIVNDSGEQKQWALYTFLDLTLEDEERIANGELNVAHIVEERIARISPVIERINRELEGFFTSLLPEQLSKAIARRRTELTNRAAVTAALSFPDAWVIEPVKIQEAAPAPSDVEPSATAEPLNILQVPRLEPASFGRLQRTIRLWADAIERHPSGFKPLTEDQISDLLAATLNATLAGANREVFSRSGKTDIYVRADVFAEGHGPAKVFVAENKKATDHKVVRFAVEEQLFKYLTTSELSAVLLLLFPQQNFLQVRDGYLATLRGIAGFIDEQPSAVHDWPLYRYAHEGRILSVCVALVRLS